MLLNLVKKDILIAKKYVLVTLVVIIAIPLFIMCILRSLPGFPSFLAFIYMVAIGEILLLQTVSQEESKYPKAAALLCTAPYPRSAFVKAKYVFFLLIFSYCCVAHTLVMLAVNRGNILDLSEILTTLLFSVIAYGIYAPFEFKYGFVKAKFFFMIMIFTLSMGPTIFFNFFANVTINFPVFPEIPAVAHNLILAVMSVIVLLVSIFISIGIYSKKEL